MTDPGSGRMRQPSGRRKELARHLDGVEHIRPLEWMETDPENGATVARLRRQTVKDCVRATVKRDYSPCRAVDRSTVCPSLLDGTM